MTDLASPRDTVEASTRRRLEGRIAFITGVAGGQGRAAALLFAAEGAFVVGCDIDAAAAAETARLVADAGGRADINGPVDLTDVDQVAAWVGRAAQHGGMDILYNNASAQRFGPIDSGPTADWLFTIDAELNLVYHVVRAAWPHLVARGGGSIINVGSVAAHTGARGLPSSAHAAAKGGVVALTRQLAVEGAPHGIRVNTISPGLIRTPATQAFLDQGDAGPVGAFLAAIPLGRPGRADEVAQVALFLAGDESSYVTGAEIIVDGGHSIAI